MPKGEDHLLKKKNKAIRKRMRRAGADSLEAIQGVQAAKRRRKAGTRRACEGMCYTLPTQDDPFNERNDKKRKRKENAELRKRRVPEGEILDFETYTGDENGFDAEPSAGYEKQLKKRRIPDGEHEGVTVDTLPKNNLRQSKCAKKGENGPLVSKHCNDDFPKKTSQESSNNFQLDDPLSGNDVKDMHGKLIDEVVISSIMGAGLLINHGVNGNLTNGSLKRGSNTIESVLGNIYWKPLNEGLDVVGFSSLGWQDRALSYVVPAVAHAKAQRSKHALPHSPIVLILVATEGQAIQVRGVFKGLKKDLGISSVSLHSGRSLGSQVEGFCLHTPEIVVSTPERLEEILAVQALSLVNISFLVIDGLDEILLKSFESHLLEIQKKVPQGARKLVICNNFPRNAATILRQLVVDPICRVTSEPPNLERSGACIAQTVSVFTSHAKRLPKMLKILQQYQESQNESKLQGVLVLVENEDTVEKLLPTIKEIGYSVAGLTGLKGNRLQLVIEELRQGSVQALVTTELFLAFIPLDIMQLVINYSFPSTIQGYEQILTGMARETVHGVLHSLCTANMACQAMDLVHIMERCSQEVPASLQMLADAASLVQNK